MAAFELLSAALSLLALEADFTEAALLLLSLATLLLLALAADFELFLAAFELLSAALFLLASEALLFDAALLLLSLAADLELFLADFELLSAALFLLASEALLFEATLLLLAWAADFELFEADWADAFEEDFLALAEERKDWIGLLSARGSSCSGRARAATTLARATSRANWNARIVPSSFLGGFVGAHGCSTPLYISHRPGVRCSRPRSASAFQSA